MNLFETLNNHKYLWNMVSELCEVDNVVEIYGDEDDIKYDAMVQIGFNPMDFEFTCFCCDYAGYTHEHAHCGDHTPCLKCPVDWGEDSITNAPPCCVGIYDDFSHAMQDGEFDEAAIIAKEIANLPINPIYKEEE